MVHKNAKMVCKPQFLIAYVNDATFDNLYDWGLEVAVTDTNSKANTSVQPYFVVGGIDNPTAIQPLANYLSTDIKIFQNFPNPFIETHQITYILNKQNHVNMAVYGYLGEEVRGLVNAFQAESEYTVTLNLSGIAAGIYYYYLTTLEERELRMMIRVK